ncbi:iron chelate uptake ABC transporter family permease subunit [Promicromonospora sp. NPDC057488]|uniref:iron chelate uptake ABC transporter family permease subunit n=1 Tax=Promicromonospora sp. NPDC057488 TaxID=3346147 RepID=UPI0036700BE1
MPTSTVQHPVATRYLALGAGTVALLVVIVASLAIGSRPVPPDVVVAALLGQDVPAGDWRAVVELRVPRTVIGCAVGIALGVAGALIQAVTRNPLADPGILGVTAGSSFFVALGVVLLGLSSPEQYIWLALAGALVATVAVALVGGSGGARVDPVRLTLAGVALTAVLAGVVSGLRISAPRTFNALLTWETGSLVDRGWQVAGPVLPFIAIGLVTALLLGGSLNALALGDDVATALGSTVWVTRVGAVLAVTLLAGGATAIVGPISFIGLMVPHVARWIAGPDQRWIIGLTLILAPALLLTADVLARVVLWPGEMPVGIVTAFVGAPVLIALVRRQKAFAL